MKFKFLNNTLQNRKFDYQPRYYDERKERLDRKKRQFQRLESGELTREERREMLRESMRGEWERADYRKRQQQSANIRIFVLVLLLCGLCYFLFFGVDEVDTIVDRLW
jgi:hypothetical protein